MLEGLSCWGPMRVQETLQGALCWNQVLEVQGLCTCWEQSSWKAAASLANRFAELPAMLPAGPERPRLRILPPPLPVRSLREGPGCWPMLSPPLSCGRSDTEAEAFPPTPAEVSDALGNRWPSEAVGRPKSADDA